jgi:YceI-like domain
MRLQTGTHTLGPENGTLLVRTGRTGAAAKAGHDLLLEVTAWRATLVVGPEGAERVTLEADGASLRVREGTGGMQKLDDDDKASIEQTIDDEVLKRQPIAFRSATLTETDRGVRAHGELTLLGTTRALAVDIAAEDDGALAASAVVTQSEWGLSPYSTLFGALKVADDVRVELTARS